MLPTWHLFARDLIYLFNLLLLFASWVENIYLSYFCIASLHTDRSGFAVEKWQALEILRKWWVVLTVSHSTAVTLCKSPVVCVHLMNSSSEQLNLSMIYLTCSTLSWDYFNNDNHQPEYLSVMLFFSLPFSAFYALVLSLVFFGLLVYYEMPFDVVIKKYLAVITTCMVLSIVMSIALYIKAKRAPSSELAPSGNSGKQSHNCTLVDPN